MQSTQITSGRLGDYPYGVSLPLIKEGQSYSGPLQSSIETVSESTEQRRVARDNTRGGSSVGYNPGYLPNTTSAYPKVAASNTVAEKNTASGSQNQIINASEIVQQLRSWQAKIDPLQDFFLRPGYQEVQGSLYDAIACRNLPQFLREAHFDFESDEVRNMLGMMQEFIIDPEDQKLFHKCCAGLKKANNVYYENIKVGKKIAPLMPKYAGPALHKQMERFTESCIKAWGYYNPGHSATPEKKDIFSDSSEICYTEMYRLANVLQKPDQDWVEIMINAHLFRKTCCILGLTLKIATGVEVTPGGFAEKFDNVFPKSMPNPAQQPNFEDYDTQSTHGSGLKSFLHCLGGVFCLTP